ncbi:hypothetical protein ACLB2K_061894 [Fragaria x ananassa]
MCVSGYVCKVLWAGSGFPIGRVATPGRLLHHLTKTRGFSLDSIKYLVKKMARAGLRNPVKSERIEALTMFKAGQYNVLVCTNLASRGLDIPSVDMVINYNVPASPKGKSYQTIEPRLKKSCNLVEVSKPQDWQPRVLQIRLAYWARTYSSPPERHNIDTRRRIEQSFNREGEEIRKRKLRRAYGETKGKLRGASEKIKESGQKKRKWGGDDAEEYVLKYSTHMDRSPRSANEVDIFFELKEWVSSSHLQEKDTT